MVAQVATPLPGRLRVEHSLQFFVAPHTTNPTTDMTDTVELLVDKQHIKQTSRPPLVPQQNHLARCVFDGRRLSTTTSLSSRSFSAQFDDNHNVDEGEGKSFASSSELEVETLTEQILDVKRTLLGTFGWKQSRKQRSSYRSWKRGDRVSRRIPQ